MSDPSPLQSAPEPGQSAPVPRPEYPYPNQPARIPPAQRSDGPSSERPRKKCSVGRARLAIILLLLLLLAGGGSVAYPQLRHQQTGIQQPDSLITIKITASLPLSAGGESVGKPAENGAHMAVDEANASHFLPGYNFVFDPRDYIPPLGMHGNPGPAGIVEAVGDAQVAGIVGPLNSSVAKTEMIITNQVPIALISPANTNPCLTQNSPETGCTGNNNLLPVLRPTGKVNYFRIATPDPDQGTVAADFAYKIQGYHTVYVLDDTEVYGAGLANGFTREFTRDGGHVLGHDHVMYKTDYTQELVKIAALHPDMVYFGGLSSGAMPTVTGGIAIYQQMGHIPDLAHTPFIGGDNIQSSFFAREVGAPHSPIYSTIAALDATKLPGAASFISRYQAQYGTLDSYMSYISDIYLPEIYSAGLYSAYSYDCAKILLNAIKAAILAGAKAPTRSDDLRSATVFRQAVIDEVTKTDYNGVLGHQSFDANGDTTNKAVSIYQLADVNGASDWRYVMMQTLP